MAERALTICKFLPAVNFANSDSPYGGRVEYFEWFPWKSFTCAAITRACTCSFFPIQSLGLLAAYLILLALQIYIVNNINVYRLENVIASIRLFTFARSCPLPSFPSKEIRSIRVTRLGRITRRFISRLIARYHFPYFIFRRHFKRKEKILPKNSSNRKFSRSVRSGKSAWRDPPPRAINSIPRNFEGNGGAAILPESCIPNSSTVQLLSRAVSKEREPRTRPRNPSAEFRLLIAFEHRRCVYPWPLNLAATIGGSRGQPSRCDKFADL